MTGLERGIHAASASHCYWTLKRPEGRAPDQGRDTRPILEGKSSHEPDEGLVRTTLPHPPSPGYGETGWERENRRPIAWYSGGQYQFMGREQGGKKRGTLAV